MTDREKLNVIRMRVAVARHKTGNVCCHGLLDWLMSDVEEPEYFTKSKKDGMK